MTAATEQTDAILADLQVDPPDESDILLPDPDQVTLESGRVVTLHPLKAIQFLAMMKIVTRGAAAVMPNLLSSMGALTEDEFTGQLLALMIFAIPEAPTTALDFCRSMIVMPPVTVDRAPNPAFTELDDELGDMSVENMFTIITTVVTREAHDLASLGKRLARMMRALTPALKVEADRTSATGLAPSPAPSTS